LKSKISLLKCFNSIDRKLLTHIYKLQLNLNRTQQS